MNFKNFKQKDCLNLNKTRHRFASAFPGDAEIIWRLMRICAAKYVTIKENSNVINYFNRIAPVCISNGRS